MNLKYLLYLILASLFFCAGSAVAQPKTKLSSADSARVALKRTADSMAAVRKYKSSKHYQDSVTKAKAKKAKALQKEREARADSMKDARTAITKAALDKRKATTDSIKAIQKERADKIERTKKYKASKRYTDSVTIVKRQRADATRKVIKGRADSLAAIRKHTLDSSRAERKRVGDSIKLVRTKTLDDLKRNRQKRMDSLAAAKKAKNKAVVAKEKQAEKKKALALEIKMKQKHDTFTNKSMLKKKWTPFRSFTQNAFTHYNYYYNANRKMEEAMANMLRAGPKENYDSLIKIYPYDPDRDSSLLAADMDSIIRKASVGIQIHDPRVKWANDLYLLMGQAYYYKGSYNNAAATFKYIIANDAEAKKKAKGGARKPTSMVDDGKGGLFAHKSVHNDAILWLARTMVQAKQVENGQAVLSLLASDAKLPEEMKGEVAIGKAFAYYNDGNLAAASDQLQLAVEDPYLPDWLRMRASFLNGQIQQNDGKYKQAVASFDRSLDFFPKLEMDFYARKNIAYNTLLAGGDVEEGMGPLKRVLNDAKYASYHDQVYYVLGKLAAKAHKPADAVKYLTLSATAPKASKKQKSLSYIALGDVFYDEANYPSAKTAYDSAAKYGGASKDATLAAALTRSKGLAEVSQPMAVIREQDSLLALAGMSKKEQQAAVRRYLADLEKHIKDSIKNAEESATATATPIETADQPEAGSWYFTNPTLMQQGAAEFKRKWGSRPLVDNWRRASALTALASSSGNSNGGSGDEGEEETDKAGKTAANGLPTEESLLAKIPTTKAQQDNAVKLIQKAYISLAKAYMKQLDDHVQASKTLDTLDARYPDHSQKEEEIYLRYQIAIRENKLDKAQGYASEFLSKFPDSKYADALRPKKAKTATANGGIPVARYYDETYTLIEQHKYDDALSHVGVGLKEYDDPTFKKRFQVAEAMSYAGKADYDRADTLISRFIAANAGDTLIVWASAVSDFIRDIRKTGRPSWYKEGPVVADVKPVTPVNTDTAKPEEAKPVVPQRPADVPYDYKYVANERHLTIILFPGIDSRAIKLKKALRDYDDTLEMHGAHTVLIDMYERNLAMAVVKDFANAKAAKHYADTLLADSVIKDYADNEIKIYVISESNYRKMLYEKEPDSYKSFYETYYLKPE